MNHLKDLEEKVRIADHLMLETAFAVFTPEFWIDFIKFARDYY
jgi:hypothetical protein